MPDTSAWRPSPGRQQQRAKHASASASSRSHTCAGSGLVGHTHGTHSTGVRGHTRTHAHRRRTDAKQTEALPQVQGLCNGLPPTHRLGDDHELQEVREPAREERRVPTEATGGRRAKGIRVAPALQDKPMPRRRRGGCGGAPPAGRGRSQGVAGRGAVQREALDALTDNSKENKKRRPLGSPHGDFAMALEHMAPRRASIDTPPRPVPFYLQVQA